MIRSKPPRATRPGRRAAGIFVAVAVARITCGAAAVAMTGAVGGCSAAPARPTLPPPEYEEPGADAGPGLGSAGRLDGSVD
jgi:hypothetical protein